MMAEPQIAIRGQIGLAVRFPNHRLPSPMLDHSCCGNDAAHRRCGEVGFAGFLLTRRFLRRGPEFHGWSPESHVWSPEPHVWSLEPQVWSPEPQAWSPKPHVWSPEPQVWGPEPQTWGGRPQKCVTMTRLWVVFRIPALEKFLGRVNKWVSIKVHIHCVLHSKIFRSASRNQPVVEGKSLRFAEGDGFEIRVGGVEQVVCLAGDDDAGEFEDGGAG